MKCPKCGRQIPIRQQYCAFCGVKVEVAFDAMADSMVEEAGLPPDQAEAVIDAYQDAQIEALKRSFFWAGLFVLVGFIFSRRLPGQPLGQESASYAAT